MSVGVFKSVQYSLMLYFLSLSKLFVYSTYIKLWIHNKLPFAIYIVCVCLCVCIKLAIRFELLEVLTFDSVRRRMSVIVRSSTGKYNKPSTCTIRFAVALFSFDVRLCFCVRTCAANRRPLSLLQRCRFLHLPPGNIRQSGSSQSSSRAQRRGENVQKYSDFPKHTDTI